MGGFNAQTVALEHPGRVRTLTLIMTSTGSRLVGRPKPWIYPRLLRRRAAADRSAAISAAVEIFRLIGSRGPSPALWPQFVAEIAALTALGEHDRDPQAQAAG